MKEKFVFAVLFLAGAAFAFCETAQEPVVIGTEIEALEETGKTPVHQAEAPAVDKEKYHADLKIEKQKKKYLISL